MWLSGCSEMYLVTKSGWAEAGSGAPKRTKVFVSGNYSMSNGGPTIDLNLPDEEPDMPISQHSEGEGHYDHLRELLAEDKSAMSEIKLEMHNEVVDILRTNILKQKK
ncbi:zinc finger CCCH domain-containing protein 20-like [Salvia divinorum]|uniref:Zinc finger CCCH domain-containing protein 20-like n=1 Tax=Salvia divinorum TaxID=28513 RepID=A0ABD1HVC8_SALDI